MVIIDDIEILAIALKLEKNYSGVFMRKPMHRKATEHHLPYSIAQCYLQGMHPTLVPAKQTDIQFAYPERMKS